MKYYTQQDLCKEFGVSRVWVWRLSNLLHIFPVKKNRFNCYMDDHHDKFRYYFEQERSEACLRLKALLIENYRGLKIRDVYTMLHRTGIDMGVVTNAILELTTQDPLVWEELPDKPPEYDSEWFNGDLTQTEIQEKMDEMDYMESILCYGYNWWYQEHPEDDPNTQEEKNGK